jgi:hypothetical protein
MSGSVSIPGVPASLAVWQKEIERRVAVLETASRLYNSAIREGTLRIQDASGNPMVTLGKLDDGSYGIHIQNSNGRTLMKNDSVHGQTAPSAYPVPVSTVGSLLSGAVYAFRPGTAQSSFNALWNLDFWSIGDKIDYAIQAYANGASMEWQITVQEVGAAAVVVAGPNAETTNVNRGGTVTIPASALVSGTDPVGRRIRLSFWARRTSGADPTTADIILVSIPRNYA